MERLKTSRKSLRQYQNCIKRIKRPNMATFGFFDSYVSYKEFRDLFLDAAEAMKQEYRQRRYPLLAVLAEEWLDAPDSDNAVDYLLYFMLVYALGENPVTDANLQQVYPDRILESVGKRNRANVNRVLDALWQNYFAEEDAASAAKHADSSALEDERAQCQQECARLRQQLRDMQAAQQRTAEQSTKQREQAEAALKQEMDALREAEQARIAEQAQKELAAFRENMQKTCEYQQRQDENAAYLREVRDMVKQRPELFSGLMQSMNDNSRSFREAGERVVQEFHEACERAIKELSRQTDNAINKVVDVPHAMNCADGMPVLQAYGEIEDRNYHIAQKNADAPWLSEYRKRTDSLLRMLKKTLSAMGFEIFTVEPGAAFDDEIMEVFDQESDQPDSPEQDAEYEVSECVCSGFRLNDVVEVKARVFLRHKESEPA